MKGQYRRGDVLVCAVARIPDIVTPVPSDGDRIIVALGCPELRPIGPAAATTCAAIP
jgi:hypothetical protein